ncbi:beta-lactamase family protein [Ruficoccus amylovorans]|uniref:Beta-lactamase family protein n=1 Tax=Ruficoccus amylovorans TaxID=1804625 RepID=A0A842HG82_9BACT|nr:serine hydrolase domain-containing protein [Ruficoccus amylovorans]MBC2594636.1 beta-lactamase family protein [Ruficoccus amylovorans]
MSFKTNITNSPRRYLTYLIALAFPCFTLTADIDSADDLNASSISDGLWSGAVVIAGTADEVFFKQAWGWMDKGKTIPMHEDAVFDLASVTKAVGTTTAIALCIDRGLIDPDIDFTNYLNNYNGQLDSPVTVRDLARHLSGFNNEKPYDKKDLVIERILRFSPVRPAGELYEYSCANFILLGLIAENASGQNMTEFCAEHVFEPLAMRNTHWAPLENPDPSHVVRQGVTQTLGVASDPPARHANQAIGNAGLFSTAEDLSAFCRMLLASGMYNGKRILSEEVVKMLGIRPDSRSPVAFGWRVDSKLNPPSLSDATMSHTGWSGVSLWIDPTSQRYVVVLTNRTGNHRKADQSRLELAEQVLSATGPLKREHK